MDYRVRKYDDGIYRWIYELDLKRNLSVLYTTLKVICFSILIPLVILLLIFLFEGNFLNALREILLIYILIGTVVLLIGFISYCAVGIYYKWVFTFYYEMDDEGITFKRIGSDKEKTETIGKLSAMIGAATGNLGLMGSGLSVIDQNAHSKFSKVYSIKAIPERDLIKVNSLFLFNEVYVNKEDYDLVLEFIESHTNKVG